MTAMANAAAGPRKATASIDMANVALTYSRPSTRVTSTAASAVAPASTQNSDVPSEPSPATIANHRTAIASAASAIATMARGRPAVSTRRGYHARPERPPLVVLWRPLAGRVGSVAGEVAAERGEDAG